MVAWRYPAGLPGPPQRVPPDRGGSTRFKRLEGRLALSATRSFKNAAEQRRVTAPALGRRIRALDGWFGLPLFVRGGQPLQLTPAGEPLARHARAATADVGRWRRGGADALARLARQADPPQVQALTRLTAEAGDLLGRDAADLRLFRRNRHATPALQRVWIAFVPCARSGNSSGRNSKRPGTGGPKNRGAALLPHLPEPSP